LELLLVLFEDALVVVLPELLGRILAGDALEDLLAAWGDVSVTWRKDG